MRASIAVFGFPTVATTTAATLVSGISATLNGTVNPNWATATVTFDWGTTSLSYSHTNVPATPATLNGGSAQSASLALSRALSFPETFLLRA